jgi:Ankyrin repeats (3 copies)
VLQKILGPMKLRQSQPGANSGYADELTFAPERRRKIFCSCQMRRLCSVKELAVKGLVIRRILIVTVISKALVTLAVAGGRFIKHASVAPAVSSPQPQAVSSNESSYKRRSKPVDENSLGLMEAVVAGDAGKVRELIARGVDVNTKMEISGGVALSSAATAGHQEIVSMLLDAGADVNADGGAALTAAAGHAEIVRLLLDRGADVNARRSDGLAPLMSAAGSGRVETVEPSAPVISYLFL